jgi:4-amino-4-deoxy-L-arabinose transferase-like glycosyltransferase
VPLACVACAAIAGGHAAVWAVVTPTFQVPDEQTHFGYAQYLAETGRLPSGSAPGRFTPEQAVLSQGIPFSIEGWPTWQPSQSRRLHRQLRTVRPSALDNEAVEAVNNPPLYYALEAIPYRAARSLDVLDRLFVMRLFSALLAALTVAFTFLFVRELMPGTPWAWTVGALAVAFQPLFAFMGGGVNNDNLVSTCGAILLYLLARAFRRGLTPRLGVALGAVAIAGMVTKSTFVGMLPGAAVGVALAAWRTAPAQRARALRGALTAGGVLALPAAAWVVVNQVVLGRSVTTLTSGLFVQSSRASISGNLSYLWQYFLPKLWFMSDRFGSYPFWEVYVQGFVGRFGWFLIGFPRWVTWVASGVYLAMLALAAAALARPGVLRRRWPELAAYVCVVLGVLVVVGIAGYRYKITTNLPLEQPRYLLALIAVYGALVAVAARGAGVRWGRAAGAFLVVLAMGHSLFAILHTIAHYYS